MSSVAESRQRRKLRVRKKIHGTSLRPRISVFRSAKHCYVQAIDDDKGKTLVGVRDTDQKADSKNSKWFALGAVMGEALVKKRLKSAIFDRGAYKYGGRLKDIADGIRSKKINF
ncbi:50S ribosomal protein L18 [Candidatus Dojkabacteria bacterium]|nr:50S ribosomal protein L18 [Candidatus Dojkabacteria bacterium]